jgi:hypothetical protein
VIKERVKDKALRVCDECGHEQWVNYWNINKKDVHICRYCNNSKTAKTRKLSGRPRKKRASVQGTSYINSSGYVEIWLGKGQEEGVSGYYREHKLLKELECGRRLDKDELIHHIDVDKTNNNLDNLHICRGHNQHRKLHSQLERVSAELIKMGVIKFNHKEGQYFLDPNIREGISKLGELLETPEKDNQQRSFSEMSEEERSTTIQKWSTLK